MEFINKELIANELKRRIDFCNKIADACAEGNLHNSLEANELLIRQYENLLYFLNSLEVKEVDLEEEMNKEWNKCEPIDEGMGLEIASIEHEQFDNIAKHFYELGLKRIGK